MNDKPNVYLDNCCFNRPFDELSQLLVRLKTETVLFIQDEIKNGNIELVLSYDRHNTYDGRDANVNKSVWHR